MTSPKAFSQIGSNLDVDLVVIDKDGSRHVFTMAPEEASELGMSLYRNSESLKEKPLPPAGFQTRVAVVPITSFAVSTVPSLKRVALILTTRTDSEFTFSMVPKDALDLIGYLANAAHKMA